MKAEEQQQMKIVEWFGEQPTWLQATVVIAAGAAVVATSGGVAVAIVSSETLLVMIGPVVVATGTAAIELAKTLRR